MNIKNFFKHIYYISKSNFKGKQKTRNKIDITIRLLLPFIAFVLVSFAILFLVIFNLYDPTINASWNSDEYIELIDDYQKLVVLLILIFLENVIFFWFIFILFELVFKRSTNLDYRKIIFAGILFGTIHITNFSPMLSALPILIVFYPSTLIISYVTERYGFLSGIFQHLAFNFIIISLSILFIIGGN